MSNVEATKPSRPRIKWGTLWDIMDVLQERGHPDQEFFADYAKGRCTFGLNTYITSAKYYTEKAISQGKPYQGAILEEWKKFVRLLEEFA